MLDEKSNFFLIPEECPLTPPLILLVLKNYYICNDCNGEKIVCTTCDGHGVLQHEDLILDSLFKE